VVIASDADLDEAAPELPAASTLPVSGRSVVILRRLDV
jgi:hypothetical protein